MDTILLVFVGVMCLWVGMKILCSEERNKVFNKRPIEVVDVSKKGIGFICENELNKDTVYEAYLTIWMKETIHAFMEIARIEKLDEKRYSYGAIFIGMSEMDSMRIEVFDTMGNMENQERGGAE